MKNQILDIFYNKIVKEAQTGRVDCFFMMNLIFNLNIENTLVSKCDDIEYDGVLIPTLKITNKELFDSLLVEYVEKAISFYDEKEFSFLEDIKYLYPDQDIEQIKEEYLIKYIICTLLANLSYSDFEYPLGFLEDRIEMFDNPILENKELDFDLETINAKLHLIEEKSPIKTETPYRLTGYVEYDDGYKLMLPGLYVGKTNDNYQVYAIQQITKDPEVDEDGYKKQIRKGLNARIKGSPEHYFLLMMSFLSLCHDKPIEVIPILIERWNAKRIYLDKRTDMTEEEKNTYHNNLQHNITDVFLRYFTKLEDVTTGIYFDSVPFEIDDRLHISMDDNFTSRAIVFNELNDKVKELNQKEQEDDYSK